MTTRAVGTQVPEIIATPEGLRGKDVSLNLRFCKWFEPPSQDERLHMDAKNHLSVTVPEDADTYDLAVIFKALKLGRLVMGKKAAPEFTKDPNALRRHTRYIEEGFDTEATQKHIDQIVRGSRIDGGYRKLEILEKCLEVEVAKGRQANGTIVKYIEKAIETIERLEGGVGAVKESKVVEASSGGRNLPKAAIDPKKARAFLEIPE